MGLCVLGACSKAPAQAWIVEDLNLLPVLYPLVTFKFVSVVDGAAGGVSDRWQLLPFAVPEELLSAS